MKYLIYCLIILSLQGCLYFNDRGISGHLYDNCHSYFDENGNFIETCDENIIDYKEVKEGISKTSNEVKEFLTNSCEKEQIEPKSTPCK